MNNFQTILVAVFLAFFVFAVLIFSGALKFGGLTTKKDITVGNFIIWGTIPSSQVSELIESLKNSEGSLSVSYIEKKNVTYQNDLIEAFAKDSAPDLFILTPDMVLKNDNFIYKIPYTNFSEKSFKNLFIDGADIYLAKDGIVGYPLLVDPLVLYYNKDMLSNEGIVYPPSTWDELFDLSSKLIKKKSNGTIETAMIAMGEYSNVNHAKDILSTLLLQSGNPILSRSLTANSGYRISIRDNAPDNSNPFSLILNFFLEFSNPSNESYTWNKSQPNSFDMFTSGRLAFYLGYASELFKIRSVNPNLSFDVTMIPQTKGTNIKRTYGQIQTLVVSKKSKDPISAFKVSSLITAPSFIKELSIRTSLPSGNRSLLSDKPSDSYLSTFFDSAIITRSWFDPDKNITNSIFSELIENSLSNRLSTSEAINKASNQLELLINK